MLRGIITTELTVEQMQSFAGVRRSKGAKNSAELMHAVLLRIADEGEKAIAELPPSAQRKLTALPAQRELRRIEVAASESSTWAELRGVLERFPPSVLLQILEEEMTVSQMRIVSGKERAEGGKIKGELIFGVLLALVERGDSALRDLPSNARSRIQAAPHATDWLQTVTSRADGEVLKKLASWSEFRDLLCVPPPDCVGADGDDDDTDTDITANATTTSRGKQAAEAAGRVAPKKLDFRETAAADAAAAVAFASRGTPYRQLARVSEHAYLSLPLLFAMHLGASLLSNGSLMAQALPFSGLWMLIAAMLACLD